MGDNLVSDDGLSRDIKHILKINETDASKVTVTKASIQLNERNFSLVEAPADSEGTSQT